MWCPESANYGGAGYWPLAQPLLFVVCSLSLALTFIMLERMRIRTYEMFAVAVAAAVVVVSFVSLVVGWMAGWSTDRYYCS